MSAVHVLHRPHPCRPRTELLSASGQNDWEAVDPWILLMMPDTPDAKAKGRWRASTTAKPAPFPQFKFPAHRFASLKSHILSLAVPQWE